MADSSSFFPSYCELSRLYELRSYPQFTAIPFCKSLIPSHVDIDTNILVDHILHLPRKDIDRSYEDMKYELWGNVVDINSPLLKPHGTLHFNGRITTNGMDVV